MKKVMKFGGSSVADAKRIKDSCKIVLDENKKGKVGVVFSAMKGITDLLLNSSRLAAAGDESYIEKIAEIEEKQKTAIKELFGENKKWKEEAEKKIAEKLTELRNILMGIFLVKECSPKSLDLTASFGERLNNYLIATYLQAEGHDAEYVDSRTIIKTDNRYTQAAVKYSESYKLIQERLLKVKGIPVITGFIGSAEDGSTTTLGRNGSDFTASIIGAATDSELIEIWTDVDGVLTADPRLVKSAFVMPEISIDEAVELSFFGAKVIHPYTMIPAVEKNIPISIKNTFNPSAPGTMIIKNPQPHKTAITGIASIDNVSIVNIVGVGMVGRTGFAAKIFDVLAKNDINVIMISQASSEHTISIVCPSAAAAKAVTVMSEALCEELETNAIQKFELIENLGIVSIIGENMKGTVGLSGKLFSTLGDNKINIYAIAQGSSERNISFVIKKDETINALNVIHKSFFDV